MKLTINKAPVANAGAGVLICQGSSYTVRVGQVQVIIPEFFGLLQDLEY